MTPRGDRSGDFSTDRPPKMRKRLKGINARDLYMKEAKEAKAEGGTVPCKGTIWAMRQELKKLRLLTSSPTDTGMGHGKTAAPCAGPTEEGKLAGILA